MDAASICALLPSVWGGKRVAATTQFKAAVQRREQKDVLRKVIAGATAGAASSPAPGAATVPATPSTADVMAASAAVAAELAQM